MNTFYLIIFFLFGLLMGSFYTVVGLRLPNKENFITNHSYCDSCHHSLSLWDMIPLISYFFLRGKCRYCGEKINHVSSFMEFFTGVLFALSYFAFGMSYETWIAIGIVSMFIILSVSDMTYLMIPDEVLIFFSGYFLILITLEHGVIEALISIVSGLFLFLVMYFIMMIGNFLFQKESLGGGDIKMMFVFGLILSPLLGVISIFLASALALPFSLILLVRKREHLIPFGPFLLLSLMLLYFTKIDASSIINWLKVF